MIHVGLEILIDQHLSDFKHVRVGFVSHPAAVNFQLEDGLTCLLRAGVKVSTLFGPEHGYYGMVADGGAVQNSIDSRTGLPVYSLYGKTKEPTPEMLSGVDILIFDMQDVGVRYYTYLSTLVYVMRGAAKAGKPLIVLDRPNPITGALREGPLVEPGFESFIGILPVPMRHGLTLGELARFANHSLSLGCELSVIPVKGWQRVLWFDASQRAWVPTSPGIPHFETTIPYVGTCLIEGTNLSEGRGTALPFEVVGAPWVDGFALAEHLNGLDLPGVRFRVTAFIPSASKHAGKQCQGIQLHITDREKFRPVVTGLHLIAACLALFPEQFQFLATSWEGKPSHFDLLMGHSKYREQLMAGVPVEEMTRDWEATTQEFSSKIEPYLLYQ